MTTLRATEFPDFDNADLFDRALTALKHLGFEDTSWRNDACPSIGKITADHGPGGSIECRIFLNYVDPAKREDGCDYDGFDVCFEGADSQAYDTVEEVIAYLRAEGITADPSGQITDTISAGARIAVAILAEWISTEDLRAINEDGKHPADFCDANIAYYGAFAAIHFQEADPANEKHAAWLNEVIARTMEIMHA